jgi:hypothetical protein
MIAAGAWDAALEERKSEAFHDDTDFPVLKQWYLTLIELTHVEPASTRLLIGAGNLDMNEPAGAYFTACWLSPEGRHVAKNLLVENPQWEARLAAEFML